MLLFTEIEDEGLIGRVSGLGGSREIEGEVERTGIIIVGALLDLNIAGLVEIEEEEVRCCCTISSDGGEDAS